LGRSGDRGTVLDLLFIFLKGALRAPFKKINVKHRLRVDSFRSGPNEADSLLCEEKNRKSLN